MTSKLHALSRPRPQIAVGDLVTIGDPRNAPNYFNCYMVVMEVEEVDGDTIYTCAINLPDGSQETMRCPRGGIVGCFREIDLNDF
jgi:hypothetical protein